MKNEYFKNQKIGGKNESLTYRGDSINICSEIQSERSMVSAANKFGDAKIPSKQVSERRSSSKKLIVKKEKKKSGSLLTTNSEK